MFTEEQLSNTEAIAAYCRLRGLPPRVILACVVCALVESSVRVLPYGDRTVNGEPAYGDLPAIPAGQPSSSRGLYQQQRRWVHAHLLDSVSTDPRYSVEGATGLFLYGGVMGQKGLMQIDWQSEDVWDIVQKVQGSEFGDATNYLLAFPVAIQLLTEVEGAIFVSVEDKFRAVNAIVRKFGGTVFELDGCWGNGRYDWKLGEPVGVVNHHFVINTDNPDDGMRLAQMLKDGYMTGSGKSTGPYVTNFFTDTAGRHYLIGTRSCGHAGQGNSSVLNRIRTDQPPTGPADSEGDITGNAWLIGIETQHEGDNSEYEPALIDGLVLLNAALCIIFNWTANRVIMHHIWTSRKQDMSWRGGKNGDGWQELIRRVNAKINEIKSGDDLREWDVVATKDELKEAIREVLKERAVLDTISSNLLDQQTITYAVDSTATSTKATLRNIIKDIRVVVQRAAYRD